MSLSNQRRWTAIVGLALMVAVFAADEPAKPLQFSEHLIQDKYGYAYGIAAADLDGDGDIDLTSADATDNVLSWFENDGKGNFKRHFIKKNEPGWFERHAIGDINGDRKPDVVVVKNQAGDVVWFENSGTPGDGKEWKRHVICKAALPGAYDVAIADLDGDGKPDVAASSWVRSNKFVWFRNPGEYAEGKEWPTYVIEEKVAETRTICAADFNGDGKIDLLGTARGANLTVWYENSGKPATQAWKKHIIDDKTPAPTHGHPADIDGDGSLDVVMAAGFTGPGGQVIWYENPGKNGKDDWKKHVIAELPVAFEAIAVDLDGDGKLEIVASAWGDKPGGRIVWYKHRGDPRGPWDAHVLKENWTRANQVIAADFNGDKRPDIAASAERGSNEVRWWRNEGVRK